MTQPTQSYRITRIVHSNQRVALANEIERLCEELKKADTKDEAWLKKEIEKASNEYYRLTGDWYRRRI
jgi:hypothetical protein